MFTDVFTFLTPSVPGGSLIQILGDGTTYEQELVAALLNAAAYTGDVPFGYGATTVEIIDLAYDVAVAGTVNQIAASETLSAMNRAGTSCLAGTCAPGYVKNSVGTCIPVCVAGERWNGQNQCVPDNN